MTRKFFGQYLIELGEVNPVQVREAIALMDRENPVIGEFAVQANFLTERDASRINREQRRTDRKFGDLAVEMNLLTKEQVREILEQQQAKRLCIGDALARLGYIDKERLEPLHQRFQSERADPATPPTAAFPEVIEDSRLVDFVLDLVPKLALRIARIQVQLNSCEKWSGAELPPQLATVTIRGGESWSIGLACDRIFASMIHAGFMGGFTGRDTTEDPEISSMMLDDCIGEFLNILAGNAMDDLEQQGIEAFLEPPTFGQAPNEGFYIELEASHGEAVLLLTPAA